jgi:hypothetical protein
MPEGKNHGEIEEHGRRIKGYRSVIDLFVGRRVEKEGVRPKKGGAAVKKENVR